MSFWKRYQRNLLGIKSSKTVTEMNIQRYWDPYLSHAYNYPPPSNNNKMLISFEHTQILKNRSMRTEHIYTTRVTYSLRYSILDYLYSVDKCQAFWQLCSCSLMAISNSTDINLYSTYSETINDNKCYIYRLSIKHCIRSSEKLNFKICFSSRRNPQTYKHTRGIQYTCVQLRGQQLTKAYWVHFMRNTVKHKTQTFIKQQKIVIVRFK